MKHNNNNCQFNDINIKGHDYDIIQGAICDNNVHEIINYIINKVINYVDNKNEI